MRKKKPSNLPKLENDDLVKKLRGVVHSLLQDGAPPAQISHTLAFIATELGLSVAPSPVDAFPRVLAGIVNATASHEPDEDEENECCEHSIRFDDNTTIH